MRELRLHPKADKRVRLGHAWVFSNEVEIAITPLATFTPGELARVMDSRGQPIGIAYVNPKSLICARILTSDSRASIDQAWIRRRLERALALREGLFSAPYYRAVFGESDGLPGLVIDRFGDVLSVQINTAGALALREAIFGAIDEVFSPRGSLFRTPSSVAELEGIPTLSEAIGDVPDQVEIHEGDMRLVAPLATGQKTGYFYDQRDNRARIARYIHLGAKVLDLFSYVGSWSIAAARNKAGSVTAVDSSPLAIEYAKENAQRNGVEIETHCGDAIEAMRALGQEGRRFDVVILDPPALIKRRKSQHAGEAHYEQLHTDALAVLREGGTLVTSSCSHHLPAERLARIALEAARTSGRRIQILERHAHAPDHPVHPAMPETEYLKTLFLRA